MCNVFARVECESKKVNRMDFYFYSRAYQKRSRETELPNNGG